MATVDEILNGTAPMPTCQTESAAGTRVSCRHSGQHHSEDLIEVFHGRATPVILCGFHAQAPIDFTKVSSS